MAKKCYVTFVVHVVGDKPDRCFLCGNKEILGGWVAENAREMTKTDAGNFSLRARFNEGEMIAFKVLSGPSWRCVDKGIFGEEIENHVVIAASGIVKEITIYNWAELYSGH